MLWSLNPACPSADKISMTTNAYALHRSRDLYNDVIFYI